jgi:hypothetical protein
MTQCVNQKYGSGDEIRLQRLKDEMQGEDAGGNEDEEGDEEAGGGKRHELGVIYT